MSRSTITAALRRFLGLTVPPPVRTSLSARQANRFRPSLEQCEAREVPATWLGTVSTDATDQYNWLDQLMPGPWDVVEFNGPGTADCDGLAGSFSVMSVSAGYTGTVTFSGATTITEFGMVGGTVEVSGDLTVYVATVYGGTLDVQGDASVWTLEMYGGDITVQGAAELDQLSIYAPGTSSESQVT